MLKLPISAVKLNEDNPRTLKDVRFQQLIKSIQDFPQMLELRPCVVDENHVVLGGNMRLRAMQHLGFTEVAVTVAKGLTEAQKKEFVIKDNGSYGDWDMDALANGDWPDAATLHEWGMEIPTDWGVVEELPAAEEGEPDLTPPSEPITVLGDLYELNGHRLHCADSTDSDAVAKTIGAGKVDAVVTDPPYGISADKTMHEKSGQQYGNAAAPKRNYEASDWDSEPIDKSQIDFILSYADEVIIWGGNYFELPPSRCWLVWDKENGGNQFADCELAWTNLDKPVRLLKHMWNGMIRKDREERNTHPTQKPLGVIEWCIDHLAATSQTVFDFYLGSGTTLIACEAKGKLCYGQELGPNYCDVIVRRWLRYMADNNRPATVKRNGTVLTPAELAEFTPVS